MCTTKEAQVKMMIERIINRSRAHEENFLTDSKTAAQNILQYLREEKLITENEEGVVISSSLQLAS